MDSDIANADSHLHVDFYEYTADPHKGQTFIRIMVPGDKTNIIETPVREHHKERFPRQWLYYQMQNNKELVIGTELEVWSNERPNEISGVQLAELQILKFQTVEQLATASDRQLQRIGMGGEGLRERAKSYLSFKNQRENASEQTKLREEVALLKEQLNQFIGRRPGRPRKEEIDVEYDVAVGATGNE
jgi:hypothetical protein